MKPCVAFFLVHPVLISYCPVVLGPPVFFPKYVPRHPVLGDVFLVHTVRCDVFAVHPVEMGGKDEEGVRGVLNGQGQG